MTFMDYNREVLDLTTCPNVMRNIGVNAELASRASFYAGAWQSVSQLMAQQEQRTTEQQQFDLILTAETIYTEAVAMELYQVGVCPSCCLDLLLTDWSAEC